MATTMLTNWEGIARFLFEVGMLKKIQRSGYPFLGSGGESIADHSFRVAIIAHALAIMSNYPDTEKVVMMALLHDIQEARTGDQNYVHKRYVTVDEEGAFNDATETLPWKDLYRSYWMEYRHSNSEAALLVHDADQIDLLLELKEQQDLGNPYAPKWINHLLKRLSTPFGRALAESILNTDWTDWWFKGNDSWWVKR
ncbi:MAG: HD domain-containing protein [Syntrophobacterales bacterium]|nr:HD domain-containing protein [Syntrophobacterales bacterium]